MAAKKQKVQRFRSWNAVVVLLILVMSLVAWRSWFIETRVMFHNDERHYALDGFWPRADLEPGIILGTLLYRHTRPHPLYNPRTDELGFHGTAGGYASPTDDLGNFPRAGHPAL